MGELNLGVFLVIFLFGVQWPDLTWQAGHSTGLSQVVDAADKTGVFIFQI